MNKIIALLSLLVLMVLVSGCAQQQDEQNPPPSGNEPDSVIIRNMAFDPPALTVKTGMTVTWINQDTFVHTVTSDSGNELDSGTLSQGQTYSHIFNSAGIFDYHCGTHPSMKAKIIVE